MSAGGYRFDVDTEAALYTWSFASCLVYVGENAKMSANQARSVEP
jgi:hypothetical protein